MLTIIIPSYKREYFMSKIINCRVTLDEDVEYRRINIKSKFDLKSHTKENAMIMELKYPPNIGSHYLTFLSKLPFRLSRNSKYINGIRQFICK